MVSKRLSYEVVDVFTDRAYAGNPLAVVYGSDGLSTEQLHAIAMEFNLSETTFPSTPTPEQAAAGADYHVRIFTPATEIPFAGHPTLGTAWTLRQLGVIGAGDRMQSCGAGLIAVHVDEDPMQPVALSADPRDRARELSDDEMAELASLVGLEPADVTGPAYLAGCGLTWSYLPVRSEAVGRARATGRRISETGIDLSALMDPVDGIDVYCSENGGDGVVRISSRCFVPGFGIPEDPATGSAAVGLGLVLVARGIAAADGSTSYRIDQGVDMGRPSVLYGGVDAAAGIAIRCRVAGQVVPVSGGTLVVPAVSGET